jgi:hypothetical protein
MHKETGRNQKELSVVVVATDDGGGAWWNGAGSDEHACLMTWM